MISNVGTRLIGDVVGLRKVVGSRVALQWVYAIARNCVRILADANLQSADRMMGTGPFVIRVARAASTFRIAGSGAFSGIREVYVRDTYLQGGALSISDGAVVLDLGANMGNFTNLALAHGQRVQVIAVEPNKALTEAFRASLAVNPGFSERTTLVRAFLGAPADRLRALLRDEAYREAPFLSDSDLVRLVGRSRIDFLKCDIEGGEFTFFGRESPLLAITEQVAIEVHAFAGHVDAFISNLASQGLEPVHVKHDPDGTCTVLARRPAGVTERR